MADPTTAFGVCCHALSLILFALALFAAKRLNLCGFYSFHVVQDPSLKIFRKPAMLPVLQP
jgi:hypothetical protein